MAARRKKILWIDDEIEYLRSHIMFLETRGYSVTPVFTGDDGIAMVEQNRRGFDIVLLDEQMPGKGGLATLEELKELVPNLPVVMVTKSEEEQLMEDALGKKIDGYLTKPVNPSQILLVCKKLLDSRQIVSKQVAEKFIRNYSENRSLLSGYLSLAQWNNLYENVTRWDLALESIDDEGLRQTHAGQKTDCNARFSAMYVENYARWIQGEDHPPLLSFQVLEKYLKPVLQEGKRTYCIVLSGMRLDQYLGIEEVMKKLFTVKRHCFYTTLPTDDAFARATLFGGMLPAQLSERYPELWSVDQEECSEKTLLLEEKLLADSLERLGFPVLANEPWFTQIMQTLEPEHLQARVDSCRKSQLVTFVVNFLGLLQQARTTSSILKEMTNDESGMRELTRAWFERSALLHLLRECAQQDCRVVLLSDHGSILATRGTELYGVDTWGGNLRYRFGTDISSDERMVTYLADPAHFGLPCFSESTQCILARENYYFVYPEKFEHYNKQYRNSFQQGGISMEEVIVPFSVFTPGAS